MSTAPIDRPILITFIGAVPVFPRTRVWDVVKWDPERQWWINPLVHDIDDISESDLRGLAIRESDTKDLGVVWICELTESPDPISDIGSVEEKSEAMAQFDALIGDLTTLRNRLAVPT